MNPIFKVESENLILEVFPIGALQVNASVLYNPKTKKAVIIDPGNRADELLKIIKQKDLDVLELLHTHAHYDHIGQSSDIHFFTKAKMALSKKEIPLYETIQKQGHFFREEVSKNRAGIEHFLVHGEELLYDDFLTLKVLETPGHSPGGLSFFTTDLKIPVVFTGDALFHGAIGRTDLEGGNLEELLTSIVKNIFTLPDETIVIPGHEEETTVGEEKRSNPYFRNFPLK